MKLAVFLALAASLFARDPLKRPKILGIAHVAFYVSDLHKARVFYEDFLGYSPLAPNSPVVLIKINEKQYVELLAAKPQPVDRLHSVGFYTDDIRGMRAYLVSKGVEVPAAPVADPNGNESISMHDPDGHLIEFVEYRKGSLTARNSGKHLPPSRISSQLAHAGINVGSLSRAMGFYQRILGFEETWRGGAGPKLSWVNMRVPDGTDYVEFMLYDTLPPEDQRGGKHHICLFVPDLQKAVQTLEERPARNDYARKLEIRTGVNRKRQMNLFDPDGTRAELMEPVTIDGKPTPPSTAPPPIP